MVIVFHIVRHVVSHLVVPLLQEEVKKAVEEVCKLLPSSASQEVC